MQLPCQFARTGKDRQNRPSEPLQTEQVGSLAGWAASDGHQTTHRNIPMGGLRPTPGVVAGNVEPPHFLVQALAGDSEAFISRLQRAIVAGDLSDDHRPFEGVDPV